MAASGATQSSFFRSADDLPPLEIVFGRSKKMLEMQRRLDCITDTDLPVLIQGESGTGKEILTRLVHGGSSSTGPLVKVTCPAIPAALFESELFGYERGAFTGALGNKPGRLESAHGGTLVLDEIAELELGLQSKLLQVLQGGQFCPIGATDEKRIEVRLVCTTNRNLDQEIASGAFRSDLFYRINVAQLHLSPLRERAEDIPDLVHYFIEKYSVKFSQRVLPLSPRMLSRLQAYAWPGNIRELENIIKRYVVFGTDEVFAQVLVEKATSPRFDTGFTFDAKVPPDGNVSLKGITKQAVRDVERQVILKSLEIHNWNRKRTAKALNISYRALLYKIQEAELSSPHSSWVSEQVSLG